MMASVTPLATARGFRGRARLHKPPAEAGGMTRSTPSIAGGKKCPDDDGERHPARYREGLSGTGATPQAPGGSRWGDAIHSFNRRRKKSPDGDGQRHPARYREGLSGPGATPQAPGGSRWGDAWRSLAAVFTPSAGPGIRARMPPRPRRPACRRDIACCRHASTNADAFPRDSTTPANTMP
jgi:hypothetical protein